jgi:hypothetical protein
MTPKCHKTSINHSEGFKKMEYVFIFHKNYRPKTMYVKTTVTIIHMTGKKIMTSKYGHKKITEDPLFKYLKQSLENCISHDGDRRSMKYKLHSLEHFVSS